MDKLAKREVTRMLRQPDLASHQVAQQYEETPVVVKAVRL